MLAQEALAIETAEGDIIVSYASPFAEVVVDEDDVYAYDVRSGGILHVDTYYEEGLRESGTLQDYWQEVQIRRNTDKRLGLIGG